MHIDSWNKVVSIQRFTNSATRSAQTVEDSWWDSWIQTNINYSIINWDLVDEKDFKRKSYAKHD